MADYLTFSIDKQGYAIPVNHVELVVSAAELTPFSSISDDFLGLLNLHGRMVPVLNTRKLLRKKPREIDLSDPYIICCKEDQLLALVADRVNDLVDLSKHENKETSTKPIFIPCVARVVNVDGSPIFILKVDEIFVSLQGAASKEFQG